MTRPTCQKCGQVIAFGETYLHPNKTEYAHQECPRPLDKLGKALKRYVMPALVAALLLWPAEPVLAALLRYACRWTWPRRRTRRAARMCNRASSRRAGWPTQPTNDEGVLTTT